MKKKLFFTAFVCLLIIVACQKGIHWNVSSQGALVKDSIGNCLPLSAAGSFIANKPTSDSNFLTIHVNVTTAGDYTISTNQVNGYSFSASGLFSVTGDIAVKLACSGTPLAAGINNFVISYNNSSCEASVTVETDSSGTTGTAGYTLTGSPGSCMNDTVKGSYIQGVNLDTLDKVVVSVNVITPGTYSIFTDTVNGYNFSASGTFTVAGVQTVTLSGNGIPVDAGNNLFTVNAASNTCGFSVNVVTAVAVTNQYHFPLTDGSYWTYDNLLAGDTIKRYINGDTLINDTSYVRMDEINNFNPTHFFYNFTTPDYNEFGKADKYTESFQYSPAVYGLLPFLKESLASGARWESNEFKGTASFNQVIYLKYAYYCLDNNLAITVNGLGFKNVYLIAVYPYIKSEFAGYGSTNEAYYYYYAKGVGLIYVQQTSGTVTNPVLKIRNWHVN